MPNIQSKKQNWRVWISLGRFSRAGSLSSNCPQNGQQLVLWLRSQAMWSHYPVWGTISRVKAWPLKMCHQRRHDIRAIVSTKEKMCQNLVHISEKRQKFKSAIVLFCLSVCLVQYSNFVRRATSVPATTQRSLGPLAVLSPARIKARVILGMKPLSCSQGPSLQSLCMACLLRLLNVWMTPPKLRAF